ncbi:MAG TPA: thiamine phosphate synthase [Bryobacteraceae bacterium]|nr:thiamine phosphate synthase [Bryobacteraceae bacterium]
MLRYYITDRKSARAPILHCIAQAVQNRVDLIQIREKDLSARDLCGLVRRACEMAKGSGTRVLVNSRADVALAAGADGVHFPANSAALRPIREAVPRKLVLAVSCHSLTEVRQAELDGADLAVFGPVFDSGEKKGQGLELLKVAAAQAKLPLLALGGVTESNISFCLAAGAAGFAGIRIFQDRYASLWNRDEETTS